MHGTKLLRAALVLSAAVGIACTAGLVAADTTAKTTTDIEYARIADHVLKLDLYEPAAGNAPLLVWVHGGAWERGSKTPMPLTGLVDLGYAVASLDFRPASAARFPGQVHDIKAAIRFLRAAHRCLAQCARCTNRDSNAPVFPRGRLPESICDR